MKDSVRTYFIDYKASQLVPGESRFEERGACPFSPVRTYVLMEIRYDNIGGMWVKIGYEPLLDDVKILTFSELMTHYILVVKNY